MQHALQEAQQGVRFRPRDTKQRKTASSVVNTSIVTPAHLIARQRRRRPRGRRLQPVRAALSRTDPSQIPLTEVPQRRDGQVAMRTLRDCQLAVSIYPTFGYDGRGGGGVAEATGHGSGRLQLAFDSSTLSIPDVTYSTTRYLGLPLPPIFQITIDSKSLTGWLEPGSGRVELDFVAEFNFTTSIFGWTLYAAPPLLVTTKLTTGTAKGRQLGGRGSPLDKDGYARLVGVADVPKTGDLFMDTFLRLPADTLAVMSAQFEFDN